MSRYRLYSTDTGTNGRIYVPPSLKGPATWYAEVEVAAWWNEVREGGGGEDLLEGGDGGEEEEGGGEGGEGDLLLCWLLKLLVFLLVKQEAIQKIRQWTNSHFSEQINSPNLSLYQISINELYYMARQPC